MLFLEDPTLKKQKLELDKELIANHHHHHHCHVIMKQKHYSHMLRTKHKAKNHYLQTKQMNICKQL